MARDQVRSDDSCPGWRSLTALAVALAAAACLPGCSAGPDQRGFKTPEEGVTALVAALDAENVTELKAILGPESEEILSSGDEVADRAARQRFLTQFREKSSLDRISEDAAFLQVGQQEWPLPIPLVRLDGEWIFDTESGKEVIIDRRIGKNELETIQVCLAYVDAQQEYGRQDWDGDGLLEYAQRFGSSPGKKDGLFWPTAEGEPPSPLGVLAAEAAAEGYQGSQGRDASAHPAPFHGYLYRILTAQGPTAPGGEYDYLVHSNLLGGFALVAYPAEYDVSGIMSFLVNHEGTVYQKDLGEKTHQEAAGIKAFDPDGSWTAVKE